VKLFVVRITGKGDLWNLSDVGHQSMRLFLESQMSSVSVALVTEVFVVQYLCSINDYLLLGTLVLQLVFLIVMMWVMRW
jgi:hypothetical protein